MQQSDVDDFPSCQLILVDMNHSRWHDRAGNSDPKLLTYNDLVRLICVFSAAHVTMHRMNTFCVVSSHCSSTKVLYSSTPNILNWKSTLVEKLVAGLNTTTNPEQESNSLAQALSMTLCGVIFWILVYFYSYDDVAVTNRKLMDHMKSQCKILVMQISPDSPSTYNSMMNSIFRYCTIYSNVGMY